MKWNRRDFCKAGGLSAFALGMPAFMPHMLRRHMLAGEAGGSRKMIFIFLRGGCDGINTVIPRGDPDYNTTTRPTIYIPDSQVQQYGTDLGNGYAQLHPMMGPMMEVYNNSALNGIDGPGNLAVIHRVGYEGQSQSHFDSQFFWENGVPGDGELEEGMIYRHAQEIRGNESLVAFGISGGGIDSLRGPDSFPVIRDLEDYSFSGSSTKVQKFLGKLPTVPGGADGSGFLGVAGGPRDVAGKFNRDLVYGTGLTLAESIDIVQAALAQGAYTPANGAQYQGSLGDKLMAAATLLKRTPARIVGVNQGGFDNHERQGGTYGTHGNLVERVAQAYQALYRDFQDDWENLVVVTMTEFGRTSRENSSLGTDHAYATCMFVGGGGVNGGVYNCDAEAWPQGSMFSISRNRYLRHMTDYRQVFAEIFSWMGNDNLNGTIPNYNSLRNRSDFSPLGILS